MTSEPELTELAETAMVELITDGGPGFTVIEGRALVIVKPLIVAEILVGDPEVKPVKVVV